VRHANDDVEDSIEVGRSGNGAGMALVPRHLDADDAQARHTGWRRRAPTRTVKHRVDFHWCAERDHVGGWA
jgi:hypothetical protein